MFLDSSTHEISPSTGLVDIWKKLNFFIMMMRMDAVTPSDTVFYKIGLVRTLYTKSLLINAVEAADE